MCVGRKRAYGTRLICAKPLHEPSVSTRHGVVVILIAQPRRLRSHSSKHAVTAPALRSKGRRAAPQNHDVAAIIYSFIRLNSREGSGQTLGGAPLPEVEPFVAT